jgi:glycosyltransferase involved in cell wall biosynthesis
VSISVLIGIDASRAFIKNRTGIEEYSYQVIKHLMPLLKDDQVILYSRNMKHETRNMFADVFPKNWRIKIIRWPYLWTQLGLSLELLLHPVDVLFVPAHTVPVIHPEKTIVTIHGLEYEFCPNAYSWWGRLYMRWSIINSCRWAKKIIAVSENTKKDLMQLYKVPERKITVVYEGCANNPKDQNSNLKSTTQISRPCILFIGRLEERKNIVGIIKAFEVLKEQYKIPHKLILAGKFGYGEQKIRDEIKNVNCAKDIILTGYVSEEEKRNLLKDADVFLFPTFYEGFGLPVLEAQSAGCPVVAGSNSSIPEVVNLEAELPSAVLINPSNAEEIADAAYKLISDENLRNDIIKRGYENVKRFSWERCAYFIANLLTI